MNVGNKMIAHEKAQSEEIELSHSKKRNRRIVLRRFCEGQKMKKGIKPVSG